MATANGCNDLHVRAVSRRLVKASGSIEPHVLAVSNLDPLMRGVQISMFCVYPKPAVGDFSAVVSAFVAGLPSLLSHFFPFAGRIATNPRSGLPEVHCGNQGAELVVGQAGVALASLDFGTLGAAARRIQLPYGDDVALSVQVVSFACGGFTVAWCTHHLLLDGSSQSLLVSAWSELARSGTLAVGSRPSFDRSVLLPRASPSYRASLDDAFTPVDGKLQVNALTVFQSFVERLYYVQASEIARLREAASRDGSQRATRAQAVSAYLWKALAGVVGAADASCRLSMLLDGRRRLAEPELRAALRNYVGNVITSSVREASVQDLLRMPLPDVAAMVREAVSAPGYDGHLQELVDWVEEHKTRHYIETAILGLGSPLVTVSAFASFGIDTDFGFGRAAVAMPTAMGTARLCSGYVKIFPRPGDDGSWMVSAMVWPQLAAALESDEPRVFRPVTAEYLGLFDLQAQRSRL